MSLSLSLCGAASLNYTCLTVNSSTGALGSCVIARLRLQTITRNYKLSCHTHCFCVRALCCCFLSATWIHSFSLLLSLLLSSSVSVHSSVCACVYACLVKSWCKEAQRFALCACRPDIKHSTTQQCGPLNAPLIIEAPTWFSLPPPSSALLCITVCTSCVCLCVHHVRVGGRGVDESQWEREKMFTLSPFVYPSASHCMYPFGIQWSATTLTPPGGFIGCSPVNTKLYGTMWC